MMLLFFLDESGDTKIPKNQLDVRENNIFAFGGVVISTEEWHVARDILNEAKEQFHIPHGTELKWKNLIRRNGPAAHLTEDKVHQFVAMVFSRLANETSSKGIVTVVRKYEASVKHDYIRDDDDIYNTGLRYSLQRLGNLIEYDLPPIADKQAMVIADKRSEKQDNRLRRHFEELVHEGKDAYIKLNTVIEGLLLQNSVYSIGIQIADYLVGAVYGKAAKKRQSYYDLVKGILRRDQRGDVKGYGIVIFPRN